MNEEVKQYFTESILEEACSQYKIDYSNIQLIQGNSNLIYDGGNKILRLSHAHIRTKQDIEAELDWLLFLQNKSLDVVKLVPSIKDELLVKIGSKDNYFTVVCFKKIQGKKVPKEDWDHNHFAKLGRLTGILHREGQKYLPKPNIRYKHWDEIPEFSAWKYFPDDERNLRQLHDTLIQEFNTYEKSKQTYGLIHYDIHHSNYLLAGAEKKLVLLDFEMICKSWYINDIATLVHYANYYPTSQNIENFDEFFLQYFWESYDQEYHLTPEEKAKIPKFALYRELMVYGYIHKVFTPQLKKSKQYYFDKLSAAIVKRRKKLSL